MHNTEYAHQPLILIVDDDRFMRTTFQDALVNADFRTVLAEDGKEAIACYSAHRPDLILLDLVMPRMDGLQVCKKIRRLPGGEYIPILLVTSADDTESIHNSFEAGATDFISKPINPELLAHRVRYILRANRNTLRLAESEARLGNAQRMAKMGNWEWDPATGSFWGSKETFRILGITVPPLNFMFDKFIDTISADDRHHVETHMHKAQTSRADISIECRVRYKNAQTRQVLVQGQVLKANSRMVPRIIGTLQDVTDIKKAEDRLILLKQAIDCLPISITICDVTGTIIFANPAEADMHGVTVEHLLGKDIGNIAPQKLRSPITLGKLGEMSRWQRESVNLRGNGEEFPVLLTSVVVKNQDACLGIVTVCEDISEKKEANRKIEHLAYYDSLTGLSNRSTFMDRLHQALALANREQRQVGLLFLDLDNFKDVNDTKGHDFGDKLLKEVARRLSASMRESDTLARLGGDEFVVVLTSVNSLESVAAKARRVLANFAESFVIDGQQIFATASIGIALYPSDGLDVEGLFKCADTAMYHAKTDGRDRYRFFSADMNQKIMQRVAMENGLRQGLENNEFILHYQPQLDVKSGAIVGVEALVRWQSPEFGLMQPNDFIPLAENTGLIYVLGEWVMRTACIQAKNWAQAGYQDIKVAINISGLQFKQPDFLDKTALILKETGVDPKMIELELTESVVMERADKTVTTLNALKRMGLMLSIDDFGTGYSSLSYLKHFPVDRIKIDRSFVSDLTNCSDDAAIVVAIISMAQSLRLKVVAEGVENIGQMNFLTSRHCDEVQGYYLALPMAAEELTKGCNSLLKKISAENTQEKSEPILAIKGGYGYE